MKRLILLATLIAVPAVSTGVAAAAPTDTKSSPVCIGMWNDEHPNGRDGFCIILPLADKQ